MPQLMNSDDVHRALRRIAHEIVERHHGVGNVALVGIHTRGVPLANSLRSSIVEIEGAAIEVGELDVTAFRDDIPANETRGDAKTDIPFDISGKAVVLVDDVLYTGRTVRAAMDALVEFGRAAQIELAVLVDRGHREIPIRPDYVGKNVPTATTERVSVHIGAVDGNDGVWLERIGS